MLDEHLEYKQYTYPVSKDLSKNAKRLKHGTFTNRLSGLERAMKIVAAYYFYKDPKMSWEERVAAARAAAAFWCGLPTKDILARKDEFADVYLWLPRYVNGVLIRYKINELCEVVKSLDETGEADGVCGRLYQCFDIDIDENVNNAEVFTEEFKKLTAILNEAFPDEKGKLPKAVSAKVNQINKLVHSMKMLYNKKLQFCHKPYSEFSDAENDVNKVTYDRIVANAIRHGPLKRRYLVCDRAAYEKLPERMYIKERKRFVPDVPLKLTAMYLMAEPEDRRTTGERYVPRFAAMKKCDLTNWQALDGKILKEDLEKYYYQKTGTAGMIFEQLEREQHGNFSKIRLNENWMKDCKWDIVEEEALDAYLERHPGSIFFRDEGAGIPLTAGKRYGK